MFTIPRNLLPQAQRTQGAQEEDENVDQGKSLFATISRALTFDRDDWQIQFGTRKRILAADENQPYLALLAAYDQLGDEIESFMTPSEPSALWERRSFRVQSLLKGARFILDDAVQAEPWSALIEGAPQTTQPTIWVSDRNCFPDASRPRRELGRTFDGQELYINCPTGPNILALIRTVPASQAEGLRELLANYVTRDPLSHFRLRQSTEWNQPFIFSINLPFYAPSTLHITDNRTIIEVNRPVSLRNGHDLSFLYSNEDLHIESDDKDSSPPNPTYLHDAVCSIILTGLSDEYWTCFLFTEDSFEDGDKQRLQAEEDVDEDGGKVDPITLAEETAASASPRVFGLHALVTALKRACDHQRTIQDCFQQSLNFFTIDSLNSPTQSSPKDVSRWIKSFINILSQVIDRNKDCLNRLKEFLDEDVALGTEGIPKGRLFQSVQNDPLAMKSLHELVEVHKNLRDVIQQLDRLRSKCDDFRRVRKRDQDEEGHSQASEAQKLQNVFKQMTTIQIVSQSPTSRLLHLASVDD
ncbi:hypothetical protein FDECE_2693 [Fusarium decemcellulare]|nr:hypothetical protein FDECE_2693 [Fusarium decemcellulare]